MKKLIFTLTFALVSVLAINAQTPQVAAPAEKGGPKISFTEPKYNYGDIPQNVPASHDFIFTNTGNAPLIITDAKPGCGCTVPTYPKEPIMPGQTGKITAVYNAAHAGSFTKGITVKSNGGDVELTITGNVVAAPAPVEKSK